jgi:hypothetical protein
MIAEGKHWQYFLVDENNNSYVTATNQGPTTVQDPPSASEYIQLMFDNNYTIFRQTQFKIGPTPTPGKKYHIIIDDIICVYQVQSGDTDITVASALVGEINSKLYPPGLVVSAVLMFNGEFFVQTAAPAQSIEYFIGSIVQGSSITTIAGQEPLQFTPDGWQDISIAWERNLDQFGNVRNFTIPLKFILDGADILRHIVYSTNFETKVYLLIKKLKLSSSPTSYNFEYVDYYRGEIDLTTYSDEESTVTINIMEGDIQKLIKANINTTYEIPCDEFFVKMDGLDLRANAKWATINENQYTTNTGSGAGIHEHRWLTCAFANSEGISFDMVLQSTQGETYKRSNTALNDNHFPDNFFIQRIPSAVGTISVQVKVNFTITLFNGLEVLVYIKNSNGTRATLCTMTGPVSSQPYTATQSFSVFTNISIAPGEKLYLISRLTGNIALPASSCSFVESQIDVSYVSKYRTTNIFAVKPLTLFGRLIEKICGDSAVAESQILQDYENLAVTCGDSLRGFPSSVCKIKTSLQKFFESFNAILSVGMGVVNSKVIIEPKEYFVPTSSPIALGDVKDLKIGYQREILFNTIKVGYVDQTYDDVNGRYEFNTTSIYTTPVTRVVKELSLISPYRADPYGIEYTRINLEGKTTTDSSSDNDVFIVNVDIGNEFPDGSTRLKRISYDAISGVPFPNSIFNIEDLTPSRMLKRHLPYINSCLHGFEGSLITFQGADKNKDLYTSIGGIVHDENANIIISTSGKFFKPYVFEFTINSPQDLVELMSSNPNRIFSFILPTGDVFTGFNLKIGIAPDSYGQQVYQLLSSVSNDLLKLT